MITLFSLLNSGMIYLLQFKSILISWKALKSFSCPVEKNEIKERSSEM